LDFLFSVCGSLTVKCLICYIGKRAAKEDHSARSILPNVTFLEAYNCDPIGAPKPRWAGRAQKQLYRADYILSHAIHYSVVTRGAMRTYKEEGGEHWRRVFTESAERATDESHEATMIHTKNVDPIATEGWMERCNVDFQKRGGETCRVGLPWPNNRKVEGSHDSNGMEYNCLVNHHVDNYWAPRLGKAMAKRKGAIHHHRQQQQQQQQQQADVW
jgi:hypothetical protein